MTAHSNMIESMVLSPDRAQLATAGADGLIEIFRMPDLKTISLLCDFLMAWKWRN